MGDNIAIDWNAGSNMNPEGPLGVVNSGYRGALMGYDLGQKGATIHALQGVDLNNPASVDAGIGNLVRANAGEQANALQNLSFTRALRQQIPDLMKSLTGGQGSEQPATPQGDPQHVVETFTLAKGAADKLLATPQGDRPQAFAQIKADMLKRGIPEQAIDAAGQDLTDAGLQGLSQHYGELLANTQHQLNPQGAPPPITPHPTSNWYQNVVDNPQIPLAVSMMKAAGIDFTPYLDEAKALALPGIQKAADLAAAGPIAQATATAQKGVEIAGAPALAVIDAWKAGKIADAQVGPALRKAQGEAEIAAAHGLTDVPDVDENGEPTGRTVQRTTAQALANATGGGKPAVRQSPAEATGKAADATLFMNNYAAEANQAAITADRNASTSALAAAHMAQELNPSNLTPWIAKNANTLNGLGIKIAAGDANKLATYQNLLSQNVKNGIAVFPKNQAEFHAITSALPDMKTPGDAAALTLTTLAAVKDQQAAQKQFRIDWAAQHPGKYSERDFQTAWSQQPGANQSVFASPLFQGLRIAGKPAVTVYPPYSDGHTYGVFLPGTPQKTVFRVR